jgi:hypothetical protein
MANRTDLEPTAALVMIWARDLYRTGSAARFYSCLDLTAGEHMRQECETVCPWYGEVILNRKWLIRHLAAGFVAEAPGPCQVVIPAAGRSPLALELLDAWNDGIASVIELDITGMEEKQRLYERAAPAHAGKIRCIPVDLSDHSATAEAIAGAGYDPDLPTVVVLEGVSYYISPAVLAGIIPLFASPDHRNRAVVEYMLPCRLVSDDRRKIPRGIWRIINRDCNPGKTVTYSPDELEQALTHAGCDHVVQHSMHKIERSRTGTSPPSPTGGSGSPAAGCEGRDLGPAKPPGKEGIEHRRNAGAFSSEENLRPSVAGGGTPGPGRCAVSLERGVSGEILGEPYRRSEKTISIYIQFLRQEQVFQRFIHGIVFDLPVLIVRRAIRFHQRQGSLHLIFARDQTILV